MPSENELMNAILTLRNFGYMVAMPNMADENDMIPGFVVGNREYLREMLDDRDDHQIWGVPS